MACVNLTSSWTTAILHSFSQKTDLLMKVIMKCVNIKLWDILGCFHYILNAPRNSRLYVLLCEKRNTSYQLLLILTALLNVDLLTLPISRHVSLSAHHFLHDLINDVESDTRNR